MVSRSQKTPHPLLVGTVLNEQTHGINHPEYEDMTKGEVLRRALTLLDVLGASAELAAKIAHLVAVVGGVGLCRSGA